MSDVQTIDNLATEFVIRWRSARNVLDEVDEGVAAMVYHAKHACTKNRRSREEALDYLEGAAFATSRSLLDVLAFDPQRRPAPSFDVGGVLVAAVNQYVVSLSLESEATITAGAQLGLVCNGTLLDSRELPDDEQKYLLWVTPNVLRHLVYDLHRVSDKVLTTRGYPHPTIKQRS